MKETTRLKLPYPEDSDSPNAPAQIKSLAERAEAMLLRSGAYGGVSFIETEQERNNEAFGLLTTPDEVTIPALTGAGTGLLKILFSCRAQRTVEGTGKNITAALFRNGVQLRDAGDPQESTVTGESTGKPWLQWFTQAGGGMMGLDWDRSTGGIGGGFPEAQDLLGTFVYLRVPLEEANTISVRYKTKETAVKVDQRLLIVQAETLTAI